MCDVSTSKQSEATIHFLVKMKYFFPTLNNFYQNFDTYK